MRTSGKRVLSIMLTAVMLVSMSDSLSWKSSAFNAEEDYKVQGKLSSDGSYVVSAFNVMDYGAVGDGEHDDTAAIEAMLFGAEGGILYFPAGTYRITKPGFKISTGMTVLGDTSLSNESGQGSVILCDFDASFDESVFMLAAGGTIVGFSFYYPHQSIEEPVAYPATIGRVSGGDYLTVRDIILYNAYDGVDVTGGAQHVANIAGTVLHTGVNICSNAEVSEFMNISFDASYWHSYDGADQTKIITYTKKNATGLLVGYADEILIYNVRCPEDEFNREIHFYVEQEMRDIGSSGIVYGNVYKTDECAISYGENYGYDDWWPDLKFLDTIPGADVYEFAEPANRYSTKVTLFNVRAYGAKGNGTADDTLAFREALEAARQNGGGIVFVPAGDYLISGKLELPCNTELLGESLGYHDYSPSRILVNYIGTGAEDYLIGLSDGSGVQGLNFYLPNNNPQDYVVPEGSKYGYKNGSSYDVYSDEFPHEHIHVTKYPYLIRGRGDSVWVENIGIVNGWNGVDFTSEKCDNFVIRSLWGSCMNQGFTIGGGSENGQISCVWLTYGSWWKAINRSLDLSNYSYNNTIGITFGDCSGISVLSAGSFGLCKGFEFIEEDSGVPENISILRAVVDMPFGLVSVDMQAGDNISILGVSTGVNSLPDIGKVSTAVTVSDGMQGKAYFYGQNLWGNTENILNENTVLYTENSNSAQTIEYSFSFGNYLTSFAASSKPDYDPPEHPEGTGEAADVYFNYTAGSEFTYDEFTDEITVKSGQGLSSFLNSTNEETGTPETDYSHSYIKYSYRFLEQYEEVGGAADWLMYFTLRNPSGYLPMWANDYAAYIIIYRSRIEIAVYYKSEKVVSESMNFASIVKEENGEFKLVDDTWHTIEIMIDDSTGEITLWRDRGSENEESLTADTKFDGTDTLLSTGGYSFGFYHADMSIKDFVFSNAVINEDESSAILTETALHVIETGEQTEAAGETEVDTISSKPSNNMIPLIVTAAVLLAATAVVLVILLRRKKGKDE